MFLELTQLSGLYGIYPRPYRLFDTSDLINNSLGTLVGFWLTPALVFFLPSRERLDAIAYRKMCIRDRSNGPPCCPHCRLR